MTCGWLSSDGVSLMRSLEGKVVVTYRKVCLKTGDGQSVDFASSINVRVGQG